MATWESDTSFRERVSHDTRIAKYLDSKALAHTFDLQRQLRHVDAIFDRVFGPHPAGEKSAAGGAGKNSGKNKKTPRFHPSAAVPFYIPAFVEICLRAGESNAHASQENKNEEH